jgi:sugar phosphate isomerase/epimerase
LGGSHEPYPYFSSSSKVWESRDWIFALEEIGYAGWENRCRRKYRLDNPDNFAAIQDNLASTGLLATVHAPYSDLNLASLNTPSGASPSPDLLLHPLPRPN